MAAITCPNGHVSETSDYCSECGKKLSGTPSGVTTSTNSPSPSPAVGGAGETCPDCGTPRANGSAIFCEVCRYNFAMHSSWTPDVPAAPRAPTAVVLPPVTADPVVAQPPAVTMLPTAPAATPPLAPSLDPLRRWEATVTVDPSLYADPDPAQPCPVNQPDRTFPLDFAENLIGRRSDRRAIYPEIDLSSDHGVSSRHTVLYRESDGGLTLLDVGSTNGTQLGGADVPVGVRTPLHDGDQITLGCWTRITIRAVPGPAGGLP